MKLWYNVTNAPPEKGLWGFAYKDQRGFARYAGSGGDIGAVERRATE